jgi:CRP/FNR family transcriptional regulator, cyclic AMP receptor protein
MTAVAAASKCVKFDSRTFLATIDDGRKIIALAKNHKVFAQGDPSDAVFYIQYGKVKLDVVSKTGREATIVLLQEGDFFGEGCLTGQSRRVCSAIAMTDCAVMRIEKQSMAKVLHREHEFAQLFLAYALARNLQYQADLVDHLFNSSEKRLARILLLLAHFDKNGTPDAAIPMVSQEALASMVGTTRSRINVFMNKFRASGFVAYHSRGRLQVHSSLLNVLLRD